MNEEQIEVAMRLRGGPEYRREMDRNTEATAAYGDAAEKAGGQAKEGAVGIDAMAASSKKGIGAIAGLTKAGKGMKSVGKSMTHSITTPIVAIAGASIYMAAEFHRQMGLIATDAGGTGKEVKWLEGRVLDLAKSTQFSPTELAKALFHIESAGYRGAKALKVLNESQKLATAGNSELESTTYALVSANKSLHDGQDLGGITKTAAQLNEIVAHGDIRLEELTASLSTGLIPTAKALGLNIQDVGSAMDIMTARGIPAQRAAYALSFTIQKLVPSTEKAQDAFERLGIGQEQLLKIAQNKGLPWALQLLKEKMDGLTQGQQVQTIDEMFGGGRMSKGLLVVIQHLGEAKEKWHDINGDVALYKQHVREAEQQPLVKLKSAWSSIEASLIELGSVLLPVVVPLFEGLAHDVGWVATEFGKLSPETKKWIVIGLGVLAVAGPMLSIIGMMTIGIAGLATAVAFLFSPVTLIVLAIAAVAAGFYYAYENVEWFHNAVDTIVGFVKAHWRTLLPLFLAPFLPLIAIIVLVITHLSWFKNAFNNVVNFFQALPGRIMSAIQSLPHLIGNVVAHMVVWWATLPVRILDIQLKFVQFVINTTMSLGPKLLTAGIEIMGKLLKGIEHGWEAVHNWFLSLPGKFANWIASIAPALAHMGGKIASEMWKGFKENLPGPLKEGLNLAEGAAGTAGELAEGAWNNTFGNIPGLAGGGELLSSGLTLVGEAGPELLNLPAGASVHPTNTATGAATVRPLRSSPGPSPTRATSSRENGANNRRRKREVPIKVELKVGRRKFGEAMALAMIDDEVNE